MPNSALKEALNSVFGTDDIAILDDPFRINEGTLLKVVRNEITGLYYLFWANNIGVIYNRLIGYRKEYEHVISKAYGRHYSYYNRVGYFMGTPIYEHRSAVTYIIKQLQFSIDPLAFLPFTEKDILPINPQKHFKKEVCHE